VARVKAYPDAKFHLDQLIHLAVWPQYTNATDRTGQTDMQTGQTDRADNGLIAQGEPFYKWSLKITKC